MDYTSLRLAAVRAALQDIARDAHAEFARLDAQQLNWRADESRWSVAQCLEHLLTANTLMLQGARDALATGHRRTLWERLPVVPALIGPVMVRSQAPATTRRFVAPAAARPSASDIPADIVQRFVHQHRDADDWLKTVDEPTAERTIMTSPFIRVITYSVLDGCRLIVAHDQRHLAQARRVMQEPGFPQASSSVSA